MRPPDPPTDARLRTIRNERLRWFAAALERAGTAAFTAGWATPLVGYSLDIAGLATHTKPAAWGAVLLLSHGIAAALWALTYKALGGIRS